MASLPYPLPQYVGIANRDAEHGALVHPLDGAERDDADQGIVMPACGCER